VADPATIGAIAAVALTVAATTAQLFLQPDAPDQTRVGPRLQDQRVTVSTYGNPITIGFGTFRVGGNVIWSTEIEERKVVREEEADAGKGGGSQSVKTTTFEYFGNFAVSFAEGPIAGFRRIWADSKIIYDASDKSEVIFKYPAAQLRLYLGTEDQVQDPLIQADQGDVTPAFRGLAYLVFEGLPLEDFGNRLPVLNAEVVEPGAEVVGSIEEIENPVSAPGQDMDAVVVDSVGRRAYTFRSALEDGTASIAAHDLGSPASTIRRLNDVNGLIWNDQIQEGIIDTSNQPVGYETIVAAPDGRLYAAISGNDGDLSDDALTWIAEVNRDSFRFDRVGAAGKIEITGTTGTGDPSRFVAFDRPQDAAVQDYIAGVGFIDDPEAPGGAVFATGVVIWDRGTKTGNNPNPIAATTILPDDSSSPRVVAVDRDGGLWIIVSGNGPTELIGVEFGVSLQTPGPGPLSLFGAGINTFANVEVRFDLESVGLFEPRFLFYDDVSHSLVVVGEGPAAEEALGFRWIRFDIASGSVVDSADDPLGLGSSTSLDVNALQSLNRSNPVAGFVYMTAGGSVLRVRFTDLSDVEELGALPGGSPDQGVAVDAFNQAVMWREGDIYQRIFFDRIQQNTTTLSAVAENLTSRANLLPADVDTDAEMDAALVRGFVLGRPMAVRQALDPLSFAYFFESVESDDQIKFVTTGKSAVRAIPERDLGAAELRGGSGQVGEGEDLDLLPETRALETELPEKISVQYIAIARDHQEGEEQDRRQEAPGPTMFSGQAVNVEVPIAFEANEAKAIAQRRLFASWLQRIGVTGALLPKHADLDPTDVVDVTVGGLTRAFRLQRGDLAAGLLLEAEAVLNDVEVFAADNAVGATPPEEAPAIGPPGRTEFFFLDVPLLRDRDDAGGVAIPVYAAYGARTEAWRGAVTQVSPSGAGSWETFDSAVADAPWGFLEEEVPAVPKPDDGGLDVLLTATDRTTQIKVRIVQREAAIQSVTEQELVDDLANPALILNPAAPQEAEFFQFANVTDNGDGTFTLDVLLRARRGTEGAAEQGHLAGARVVFLGAGAVRRRVQDLAVRGDQLFYRTIPLGEIVEKAIVASEVNDANSLKPLAPVDVVASPTQDGSTRDPVVVTWTRRTRVGQEAEWNDEVENAPIGEESEEYEVDLLDPAGTTVQQTFTGIADDATGVSISDAEQQAAGYSSGDLLRVRIFQISAAVGRGFGRDALV